MEDDMWWFCHFMGGKKNKAKKEANKKTTSKTKYQLKFLCGAWLGMSAFFFKRPVIDSIDFSSVLTPWTYVSFEFFLHASICIVFLVKDQKIALLNRKCIWYQIFKYIFLPAKLLWPEKVIHKFYSQKQKQNKKKQTKKPLLFFNFIACQCTSTKN